jgi:hypothetical protein
MLLTSDLWQTPHNTASAARSSGSFGADSDGRPNPHPFAGEQVPLWGHSLLAGSRASAMRNVVRNTIK